jgi:hypothetical protein
MVVVTLGPPTTSRVAKEGKREKRWEEVDGMMWIKEEKRKGNGWSLTGSG